jgi:hypothetical protein
MSTRLYRFILKYVIPQATIFHGRGPSWFFKQRLRENMQEGDVLLSKSSFNLTNILIGGKYSHAAVVVSKDKIAEMSANDFDIVDVDKFCKGTTRVTLLRLKIEDKQYAESIAKEAMSFADREYDLDFKLGVEALYCSELCYQADYEGRFKCDLSDLAGIGRPYISPYGLYIAEGLKVVSSWEDKI